MSAFNGVYEDDEEFPCDLCGRTYDEGCTCDECGMMSDGTCSLAGTEHCDWDCTHPPLS